MKNKLILIIFLIWGNISLLSNIDSLKNEYLLYSIGNYNEDCFPDSLYGEIIDVYKILPKFIIWGDYDSTVVCDSLQIDNYDTLNVIFTTFEYDTNDIDKLTLNTSDFTNDLISDFNFSYNFLDTNNLDSICHLLIIGDNFLSKNDMVYVDQDSLLIDSLSFYMPLFSNGDILTDYGETNLYIINEFVPPPPALVDNTTDIIDSKMRDILVYPNPSQNQINIKVAEVPYDLEIIDITGNVLNSYLNIDKFHLTLNLSHYSNGSYLLKFKRLNKTNTIKFIKQN